MKGIKTLEEAQKLPEKSPIEYKKVMIKPHFRAILAVELDNGLNVSLFETGDRVIMIGYDKERVYEYAV